MIVYLVIQDGVYRHGIAGIFATLDEAKAAADKCAAYDRDHYHDYDVIPFPLGAMTAMSNGDERFPDVEFNEASAVYTVSKPRELSRAPNGLRLLKARVAAGT